MAAQAGRRKTAPSVDAEEVAKFAAMAQAWWDPDGAFRPLHRLNPARLAFIRDQASAHFGRDALAAQPLAGLAVLDIGCGGGLLCEPMDRLGARVTGIDAAEENVRIATLHAEQAGLSISYRHATAEELAESGARYDLVLNMEVVEHVADLDGFLNASCTLVKPSGAMVVATLNRTPKAFLLAIVGAEYLLRWLPRGTHDWRRFVRPSELAAALRRGHITVSEIAGLAYNPLTDAWRRSRDLDVNYMVFGEKE
jgi:2-polyprenyl-6-hydroxyphenyl methylase/3-demethylubiquinone-9 3-methyltransferase